MAIISDLFFTFWLGLHFLVVVDGVLDCTSEREVCLPANYSRFQLPNKGKQTIVAIGKLSSFFQNQKNTVLDKLRSLQIKQS